MYHYLIGTITERGNGYVSLETKGGIGFLLTVSDPLSFEIGKEGKFYVHEVYTESEHYLAGFPDKKSKEVFIDLISVKGIGPKTALSALSGTTPEELSFAIEGGNLSYLKKLPGIGPKAASQIILDLKGHLASEAGKKKAKNDPARFEEVREALRGLGFKARQVDEALAKIDAPNLPNEEILRLALRHLRKGTVQ